jgi:hypothetical protein
MMQVFSAAAVTKSMKDGKMQFRRKPNEKERKAVKYGVVNWITLEGSIDDGKTWSPFIVQFAPTSSLGVQAPAKRKFGPVCRFRKSESKEIYEFFDELAKYGSKIIAILKADKTVPTSINKYDKFTKFTITLTEDGKVIEDPMVLIAVNCSDEPKIQEFNQTQLVKLIKGPTDSIIEVPLDCKKLNVHKSLNFGCTVVPTVDLSTIAMAKDLSIQRFIKKAIVKPGSKQQEINSTKGLTPEQLAALTVDDTKDDTDDTDDTTDSSTKESKKESALSELSSMVKDLSISMSSSGSSSGSISSSTSSGSTSSSTSS